MLMRIFCRLVAVLAAAVFAQTGSVRAESWLISSETDFPPYNYYQGAQFIGIDTEIVRLIVTELGYKPVFVQLPWKRVVQSVESNEVDLGYQFVGTKERFEKFRMVGPFRNGVTTLMFAADSNIEFQSVDDLTGLVIGTVRGYAYAPEFDKADHVSKEEATDNETNVRKLAAGRLHAIVGDRDTLAFLAARLGYSGKFKFAEEPLAVVPRYIAFPKERAEAAKAFQAMLDQKISDGAVDAIINKYTTIQVSQLPRQVDEAVVQTSR